MFARFIRSYLSVATGALTTPDPRPITTRVRGVACHCRCFQVNRIVIFILCDPTGPQCLILSYMEVDI